VQALASGDVRPVPRLWLVTSGAQPAGEGSVTGNVAHGALWGFGRVVALEHPEVWGGLVDLDPAPADLARAADALVREVLTQDVEDQVAFRDGSRHVVRVALDEEPPPRAGGEAGIRPDSGYLITGGLGGIGLAVARWLIAAGARHLVLLGRRAPDTEALATLAELTADGATVDVLQADVTRAADVRSVVNAFGRERPPLRGVFHAAGVLDDGALLQQDWERYKKVLAPKVTGAHHLDVCTRGLQLDFFVLFSSFVAVLGSPGQSNYAAANAVLDSLAHHRKALGLPATSVNWGPWEGLGMTGPAVAATYRWSERGARTIVPAEGTGLLERILERPTAPQVGAFSVDWEAYHRWLPGTANREVFTLVHTPAGTASDESGEDTALFLPDRLAALDPGDRPEYLVSYLAAQVAEIVGFASEHAVDPDIGFFQLGLDSLMNLKLLAHLREETGDRLTLPGTLTFDHPTCASLAAHLLDELALVPDEEPQQDEAGVEGLLAEMERLSADEETR
jgi:aryl carrier-like protein